MRPADPNQRSTASDVEFTANERAVVFECEGEQLVGIIAAAAKHKSRGVLVIVGGPQYRAGSHRQFTLLARRLASEGYPTFRFDYRGMGDGTGSPRTFEMIEDDVEAAIAMFQRLVPGLEEIVLLGLCDAASAAMMYGAIDKRVHGIVALNPWIRSDATLARAHVRHYYPRRVMQREFWEKLFSGNIHVRQMLVALLANLRMAGRNSVRPDVDFIGRMRRGLETFPVPTLLVLSGNDLVAHEFLQVVSLDPLWARALSAKWIQRVMLPGSDHTFSRAEWRIAVEQHVLDWLDSR